MKKPVSAQGRNRSKWNFKIPETAYLAGVTKPLVGAVGAGLGLEAQEAKEAAARARMMSFMVFLLIVVKRASAPAHKGVGHPP
jgi:hypothetical protein